MTSINHSITETAECYGGIFPDPAMAHRNITNRGKVFSARIESHGIGVQDEELAVDETQWRSCMECPQFDGCYKLSTARLLFQTAVQARF